MAKKITEVYPPEGGWKERTWYLVEASYFSGNPVHRCLFYTGFLQNGKPCGYNHLHQFSGSTEGDKEWTEVRYLKAIRPILGPEEMDVKP